MKSRNEILLESILSGEKAQIGAPQSRNEALLMALYEKISGVGSGSGGGSLNPSDLNPIYTMMIGGESGSYKRAMRTWFEMNGCHAMSDCSELLDQWYNMTRCGWDGGVRFYQPNVSAVSTGEKIGDNAGLKCVPSTDAVKNQDDYAELPLFAPVDCNWIVNPETLKPEITAIEGIWGSFERYNPEKFVGVLQMTGYHWYEENETYYTHGYTDNAAADHANLEPLPEAVRVDGSVSPWVVHGKYFSTTVNGKMTCYSGAIPTAWISHNSLYPLAQKHGSQYSGGTSADNAFIILMAYLKYASLTLDGILQGCLQCNYQYKTTVSESGVKRVILTSSQANNFEIGMGVVVGQQTTTNNDRNNAPVYSVTGQKGAIVTDIKTVEGGVAVYVDVDEPFDTVADQTMISSFHWPNGSCDYVLGNDGSPGDNTNAKYPAKIQGIEFSVGFYEVVGDSIQKLYQDDQGYWYELYTVNRSALQKNSVTANYKASGIQCAQQPTQNWFYIKENGYNHGLFYPAQVGGSSSTYTRDAFYMNSNAVGERELLLRGSLSLGSGLGGLSNVFGYLGLGVATWSFGARLSPNGNRGEFTPPA